LEHHIQQIEDIIGVSAPQRLSTKNVNAERLESLRESVIDFCHKSKSFTQPMHLWNYISQALRGKESADLWWVVRGNEVESFLIMNVYHDFDGQWTGYAMFGYSKSYKGREQYRAIVDDYKHKGVTRFQFTTVRNPKVFQRWLGENWKEVGTLFQARY
jgi:hypothetical protein